MALYNSQLFHGRAIDMRWSIANEARSADLLITSLISNKRKWNNCFLKFLKLQKFGSTKYERKKARNFEQNQENLMKMRCCVIGLSQKHFLPFRLLLNVGIDPNFSKKVFFFFALFREKFCFPAEKKLGLQRFPQSIAI